MSDQTYATHVRWLPPFHFFVMPVLLTNLIVQIVSAVKHPGLPSAWAAVVALAILLGVFFGRWMPLRVQDRLIRLEERRRLERLLPSRAEDIAKLSRNHLVALRFACDAEVPGLVDRILAGEIRSRRDIKSAVKTWRPDYLRV
ncbi:MAG TPA: DUF6526 family protein [Gemmatimonadales bacterium]|nr:DUF6526 family protein [Gemmatimonadales bacterium]